MPEIDEVRMAKEIGYKGHNRYLWHACVDCGKQRWVALHGTRFNLRCRSCSANRMIGKYHGDKNPNWRRGRTESHGYILIHLEPSDPFYPMTNKQHYIPAHRLVMARHLNHCLDKHEIVHHLNGITTDNHIRNLALVNKNNHERRTIVRLLQKRIRELEAELSRSTL